MRIKPDLMVLPDGSLIANAVGGRRWVGAAASYCQRPRNRPPPQPISCWRTGFECVPEEIPSDERFQWLVDKRLLTAMSRRFQEGQLSVPGHFASRLWAKTESPCPAYPAWQAFRATTCPQFRLTKLFYSRSFQLFCQRYGQFSQVFLSFRGKRCTVDFGLVIACLQ